MSGANTKRAKFWDEVIRDYPASENSIPDIVAETGCDENAVRRAYRRRGFRLTPDSEKSIRERAYAMKPLEAVDFLLGIIEQVSWANPEAVHPTDCVKTTPMQKRLLRALYDSEGRVVTRGALHNTICAGKSAGEIPYIRIIDVMISHIRKALKGHPWQIETVWGEGYRLKEATP